MSIRRRLYYLLVLIFLVIMAGSTGYYIIFNGEPKFLDCIYMTVVSLTTVGYGEVIQITGNDTAQIFTMLLITFGMGVILYGISSLTALFLEGELSGILRKKKMAKHKTDEIEFNPAPTQVLTAGTTLIVMGAVEEIARARESF